MLADHGADPSVTAAAVDRISELAVTRSALRDTVVRRAQCCHVLALAPIKPVRCRLWCSARADPADPTAC